MCIVFFIICKSLCSTKNTKFKQFLVSSYKNENIFLLLFYKLLLGLYYLLKDTKTIIELICWLAPLFYFLISSSHRPGLIKTGKGK